MTTPPDSPIADLSYTSPETPSETPSLKRIFLGDDGLRAGWCVLLFLLLVALCGSVFAMLVHHHILPKPPQPPKDGASMVMTPRPASIFEFVQFAVVAIPAFIMSFVERRSFQRYGLVANRRTFTDFCTGFFWGLLALSALVGVLYLAHGIAFDGILLHGATAFAYACKWGLVFFLVGLAEEFVFRGYLQYTVARGVAGITRAMDPTNQYSHVIGFWVSAFLFSICFFALGHLGNGGENFIGIFQVALAGTVFAFSLYRTGSLWWAIGLHTAWDWAQSFLYGTPDSGNLALGHFFATHPIGSKLLSGGADGPEGSVLGIPTLLLVAVIIHFTLPRRPYPLTPDQMPPPENTTPGSSALYQD